jgi:molecular chaperone Hsp33
VLWRPSPHHLGGFVRPTDLHRVALFARGGYAEDVPNATDQVIRSMTDDGTFRVITARTTDTVRGALAAQGLTGPAAQTFTDLLTAVVLVRETMAPDLRVQAILRGAHRSGTLVADSHPTGSTRGLASSTLSPGGLDLGPGAVLQLMRTLYDGRLHQGIVAVPDGKTVSEALMVYMQESEQVTTVAAVGTTFDGDVVTNAGGYLVQLLPGAERGPLMVMTERLEAFRTIDRQLATEDFEPEGLMQELLYAMPFTWLGKSAIRFECWCSQASVLSALSTLPRSDIQEMVDAGEVLEISCDYCRRDYQVAPVELHGLLQAS